MIFQLIIHPSYHNYSGDFHIQLPLKGRVFPVLERDWMSGPLEMLIEMLYSEQLLDKKTQHIILRAVFYQKAPSPEPEPEPTRKSSPHGISPILANMNQA